MHQKTAALLHYLNLEKRLATKKKKTHFFLFLHFLQHCLCLDQTDEAVWP